MRGISYTLARANSPGSTMITYSIASHLDKFFVSKEVFTSDCQYEISPCPLSDHNFVSFVFDISDAAKRAKGLETK